MENHTKDSTMKVSSLNCIDLANDDLYHSVASLKQACLDCGFFYVINHGINEEFMEDVFEQSKKFFALPLEEKMKVLRNEKHRGYTPVLDEKLDPKNQVNGDHKEGYYIGIEVPKDDPHWDKPFYGPNPWPDADVLPGWRETMEKYHQEALRVSMAIGKLLALALDLDVEYFDRTEMLGKPIATMRLLRYQGISDPSKGIYACGAHSDFGMMTLLATDGVMGLQICKDKNATPQKWEYVPPIKGAFIVNLGDMLERWSNGFFKSTLHRVLGNGQERYSVTPLLKPICVLSIQSCRVIRELFLAIYSMLAYNILNSYNVFDMFRIRSSKIYITLTLHLINIFFMQIPFFVEPNHDCLVECLPTCKSESDLPKYPPIKCSTYLTQRYDETHAKLSIYHQQT